MVSVRTFPDGKSKNYIQYAMVHEVKKDKKVRVIVERFGNGKYKFLSVMPHNKKSKRA